MWPRCRAISRHQQQRSNTPYANQAGGKSWPALRPPLGSPSTRTTILWMNETRQELCLASDRFKQTPTPKCAKIKHKRRDEKMTSKLKNIYIETSHDLEQTPPRPPRRNVRAGKRLPRSLLVNSPVRVLTPRAAQRGSTRIVLPHGRHQEVSNVSSTHPVERRRGEHRRRLAIRLQHLNAVPMATTEPRATASARGGGVGDERASLLVWFLARRGSNGVEITSTPGVSSSATGILPGDTTEAPPGERDWLGAAVGWLSGRQRRADRGQHTGHETLHSSPSKTSPRRPPPASVTNGRRLGEPLVRYPREGASNKGRCFTSVRSQATYLVLLVGMMSDAGPISVQCPQGDCGRTHEEATMCK